MAKTKNNPEIYLLINNVRSLYNIGSIFRTADAVGITKIFLGGYSGVAKIGQKTDLHPKLSKTALAGINIDWEHCPNTLTKISELKRNGVKIYSLELTDKAISYDQTKYDFPLCLVVGHERDGVDQEIIEQSDETIYIPMNGAGKSLNVSVATAVAFYEIIKVK